MTKYLKLWEDWIDDEEPVDDWTEDWLAGLGFEPLASPNRFVDGKKEGPWDEFTIGGSYLRSRGNYSEGREEGYWQEFFESGKLSAAGWYKHGKKTGRWDWFDLNGNIMRTYYF